MVPSVAALLVSHDGARWLPAVIDGIRAQRAPLDRRRRRRHRQQGRQRRPRSSAPSATCVRAPGSTSFPAAVALGLERLRERGEAPEWVWILHDDANPDPGALRGAARGRRRRPRRRRPRPQAARVALAASGCSSSASPSAAPGVARPAWSAASTTRASTTRYARCSRSTPPACWCAATVLEALGGFDPQLPIFGNDIDFGWRAAAAGHTHADRPATRSSSTPRRRTAASGVRR